MPCCETGMSWRLGRALVGQLIDSRGRHSTSVPDLGFPTVDVDVGVPPKLLADDLVHNFHPLWMTHQIDVIQEF